MSNLNQPLAEIEKGTIASAEDIGPYVALWHAAVNLLIADAAACSKKLKAAKAPTFKESEAYRDIIDLGPITRYFARFCLVDPVLIREMFNQMVRQQRGRPAMRRVKPERQDARLRNRPASATRM